jgi:ribosome biogenesis GTPase A
MGFWPVAKKAYKDADIVLFILDARMPELSLNEELKKKVKSLRKRIVFVFNKIDLVSNARLNELRQEFPTSFFVSGTKNIGIGNLKKQLLIMGKRMKLKSNDINIGVIGYPNIGKSAIINALAKRARTKVARYAGTTRGLQFVNVGARLKVIDTPGVIPFYEKEAKLGMLGAKNPEKLKNPLRVAIQIIKLFRENSPESFKKFYGCDFKSDEYETLLEIGRKRNFLIKGGIIDERRAILQVIRDWQKGNLKLE